MAKEFKKEFIKLIDKHSIKQGTSICINENNWDCKNCFFNKDIIDDYCSDCGGTILDSCTLLEKIYYKFKEVVDV